MNLRSQLLAIGAALAAGHAHAETPAPKPPPTTIPEKIAPGGKPEGPTQNLSEKLNQSNGVIQPKEVDPEMHVQPPATGDPNVIHPGNGGPESAPQAK